MTRSVAQMAKILGLSTADVKSLAWKYRECLTQPANPPRGKSRQFDNNDALKLIYIVADCDDNADITDVLCKLDDGEHRQDRHIEHLYLHTPILQEPPADLDETWRHGSLYTPSFSTPFELARNYRWCADRLLQMALQEDAALDLRSPVLFAYRHALE